jgi:hypothetical protein
MLHSELTKIIEQPKENNQMQETYIVACGVSQLPAFLTNQASSIY